MKGKIREFLDDIAFLVKVTLTAILVALIVGLLVTALILGGMELIKRFTPLRPAELPPDTPSDGVAWVMPEAGEVPVWLSPVCAGEAETAVWLDSYTEGDGPAPEWWRPDEEMSAEWEDHSGEANKMVDDDHYIESDKMVGDFAGDINVPCKSEPHPPIGIDPGGIDWNVRSTVWGWDGHGAEAWEIDLYARIVYLEFWGTSPECCEAGADSILRLWDSGYFGDTLGGVLSARAENGSLVYTTYGFVWDAEYDPDGLAEMRELCEERFYNGPEWGAEFFQLYGFPDWAVPCYEIDGVYFSTGKGWNQ